MQTVYGLHVYKLYTQIITIMHKYSKYANNLIFWKYIRIYLKVYQKFLGSILEILGKYIRNS